MTRREKVLATTLVSLVVVFGGGVLFHLFVYEPVSEVSAQLAQAREQLLKKNADLVQERKRIDSVLRVDPRLSQWQKISLPPRDPEAKKKAGVSPEELKREHLTRLEVEYEQYLSELMSGNGLRSVQIKKKQPDRRAAGT